jgi:Uma2 family endonuclease
VILDRPAHDAGLFPSVGGVNIGAGIDDFGVPDGGLHRTRPREVWFDTVALAIEIVSPGDETWEKLPFYAAHHMDELLIVDPDQRKVHWLALVGECYEPISRSEPIALGPAELEAQINWP